jgi:hypothetical protein
MTTWDLNTANWTTPFNTPLECGVRSTILLAEIYPIRLDIQRLLHYDYILVHSGDVEGGPPSLHPPTPHRSGELLVRRPLIEKGIMMMMSRSVIECEYTSSGIVYCLGEWGVFFIDSLQSAYTVQMRERAKWVASYFDSYSDEEMTEFVRARWSEWGSEFEFESIVRGDEE